MKFPSRIFAVITKNKIIKIRHSRQDALRAIRQVKWENHIPRDNQEAVIFREYELVKKEPIEPHSTTP